MTPAENLYYAVGELAYAMASADGLVQKEERARFSSIVAAELRCENYDFDVAGIIFQIMEKEKNSSDDVYKWALKSIKTNSHYLSPELKTTFIRVLEKVAKAFPPVTESENALLQRFKKDIEPLHGDPVYYSSKK